MTDTAVLERLRARAAEMAELVQVMAKAQTLADWADAETYLATLMEPAGDMADQVEPENIGFWNGYRRIAAKAELLAKYREVTA